MLVNSKYMKYDLEEEEYYITIDGVINYTNYSSDDLGARGINAQVLKEISHSIYRLIYSARRKQGKFTHKKYMRRKIYDNTQEEVKQLRHAMIEATKGALESGMDFNAYIDNPKDNLPYTVIDELRQADLIDSTEKRDNDDLDITYTEEEKAYAT